jgi:hypothetical protein
VFLGRPGLESVYQILRRAVLELGFAEIVAVEPACLLEVHVMASMCEAWAHCNCQRPTSPELESSPPATRRLMDIATKVWNRRLSGRKVKKLALIAHAQLGKQGGTMRTVTLDEFLGGLEAAVELSAAEPPQE